ncbi:MAG: lactate utilization protein [Alphaproteobacteria bacterium]
MSAGKEAARAAILARVRASLGRGPGEAARPDELARRLAGGRPNLIPARSRVGAEERLALFIRMAEEVAASTARCASPDEVPGAVGAFLAGHNLPSELVMAPEVEGYPWHAAPTLTLRKGRASKDDLTGLTGAFAGIAETGTLMMVAGPKSPTTLNFLPDNHVVLLPTGRIFGAYEEAWAELRRQSPQRPPTTVNFITGPSRTADIEQTMQLGAHGPRRLHIILVGPDAPPGEAPPGEEG